MIIRLVRMVNKRNILPLIQSVYFIISSLWPLVHIESFFRITGSKHDVWLVKTVSLILFPYGLMAIYALNFRRLPVVGLSLAICCFSLAFIDVYYYLTGTLKWVYLIDAAMQTVFLTYWIWHLAKPLENQKSK